MRRLWMVVLEIVMDAEPRGAAERDQAARSVRSTVPAADRCRSSPWRLILETTMSPASSPNSCVGGETAVNLPRVESRSGCIGRRQCGRWRIRTDPQTSHPFFESSAPSARFRAQPPVQSAKQEIQITLRGARLDSCLVLSEFVLALAALRH